METVSMPSLVQAAEVAAGLATQQETLVQAGTDQSMAAGVVEVGAAAGSQGQADRPTHQARAETEAKALSL